MKSKMMLLSTVLMAASLASCGGGGKTRIGVLQFGSFEALEKAKQGFVDAINATPLKDKVVFDIKNAAADGALNSSGASTLAANSELVYGVATPSASALKNAVDSIGSNIPVLFSAVTNALGANLVKSLEEPEGNCTGVLDLGPIEEEISILSKFDNVDKVSIFFTSTEVNSVYQAEIAEAALDELGIAHERRTITNASEISTAFNAIPSDVDAVFLPTDDTIANAISTIKDLNETRTNKLIIVGSDTGLIDSCTFALGVDYYQCGKQAGAMAISLLNKKKTVKQIPVETCDVNSIFINKTWSDRLGISVPEEVLSIEGAVIK